MNALFRLLFFTGVAALAFLLGTWVAWRNSFPYSPHLQRAFISAETLTRILGARVDPEQSEEDSDASAPVEERKGRGVTRSDPGRTSPGMTLVLTGREARLLELDGTVRHQWVMTGPDLFPNMYWRKARVLKGGDLLVIVQRPTEDIRGWQLRRIGPDSRMRWSYPGPVHHDFDVAPDGRIYVLDQVMLEEPPAGFPYVSGPTLDERVLVISPEGKLLRAVSILEALGRSPYAPLLKRIFNHEAARKDGDYLHSNNVDYVDAATAARFSFVKEGQVLLSFRELHLLAALDLETATVTWLRRGPWFRQHDPDFLENGNLLVFDNLGDWDRPGKTRILEYDPRTSGVVWEWPGERGERLASEIRGEQQMLPNGNVLLNEFNGGRLLEITRSGEVVWEFVSPFPHPRRPERILRFYFAERVPLAALSFPFNEGKARP